MDQKEFEETEKIYQWALRWRKRHPTTKRIPLSYWSYWKKMYQRHRRISSNDKIKNNPLTDFRNN